MSHVWRFPTVFVILTALTCAVLVAGVFALAMRSRGRRSPGLWARAWLAVPFVAAPLVGAVVIQRLLGALGAQAMPGMIPVLALAPSFLAAVLLLASRRVIPGYEWVGSTLRWRLAFLSAAMFYVVLNTVNWCAPGWCETFGFPTPYYRASDAIIAINGWSPGPFWPIGLGVDLMVAVICARAVGSVYRRRFGAARARVA
jgi:hypothetical protein